MFAINAVRSLDWHLMINTGDSCDRTEQFQQAIEALMKFFVVDSSTRVKQSSLNGANTTKVTPMPCSMFKIHHNREPISKCSSVAYEVMDSRNTERKFEFSGMDTDFMNRAKVAKVDLESYDTNNNMTQTDYQTIKPPVTQSLGLPSIEHTVSRLPYTYNTANTMESMYSFDTLPSNSSLSLSSMVRRQGETMISQPKFIEATPRLNQYGFPLVPQYTGFNSHHALAAAIGNPWNTGHSLFNGVNALYQMTSSNLGTAQYLNPYTSYGPSFVNNVEYENGNLTHPAASFNALPGNVNYQLSQAPAVNMGSQFGCFPTMETTSVGFPQSSIPVDFGIPSFGVARTLNDLEASIDFNEPSDFTDSEPPTPSDGSLSQCSNESNKNAYWNLDPQNAQSFRGETVSRQNDITTEFVGGSFNNCCDESFKSKESLIWSSSPGEPLSSTESSFSDMPSLSQVDNKAILTNETRSV